METIFRTNVQGAYAAGRWRQLQDPAVKESHPFLGFDATLDDRVTTTCKACDGTRLPADHAFWKTHTPPLHFNCRSAVVPLTEETANELGITELVTDAEPQQGFGLEPDAEEWAPETAKYPEPLRQAYRRKRSSLSPAAEEAPPPPPRSEVILKEKLESAKGSNEGGVYLGADGVKRYVKFYADPSQAHCEHLANRIYRDLGFDAPDSEVFEHEGRIAYASVIVEGTKTLGSVGINKARARKVMNGFAVDVLTGNWDVVGLSSDNVLVLPGGRMLRVDNGGTFLYRAKAGRKPTFLLNQISEWEKLRDPSVNPSYAAIAKAAEATGDEAIRASAAKAIKAIVALRKRVGSWGAYVDEVVPGLASEDRVAVIQMLNARTDQLAEKLKGLARPRTRRRKEVVFDFESEEGRRVRKWLSDVSYRTAQVYDPIFAQSGLSPDDVQRMRSNIGSWVGEYRTGSKHSQLYGAFASVKGQPSEHTASVDDAEHLRRVQVTRKARWTRTWQAAGMSGPEPTHLRVYRGMSGIDWVKDVADAWADETSEHVSLKSHELASWSFSKETGRSFARNEDEKRNVIFSWKVPVDDVVYDQFADDAAFLTRFLEEHEVIAGPGHDRGQALPKEGAIVTYKGEEYTFGKRKALIAALKKDGILS